MRYELTDQRLATWLPQVLDEITTTAPDLTDGHPAPDNG